MSDVAAPFEVRVSVLSRVGGRERNEDACGYCSVRGLGCYVLADGAGGHGGGDVASRIAIQAVLDDFTRAPEVSAVRAGALAAAANDAVIARQRVDAAVADMRSTLVVLLLDAPGRRASWAHVGDSRLYLFRQGALAHRTRDHSLLQDLIDAGMLSDAAAAGAPHRAVLTASLGGEDSFFPTASDDRATLGRGDAFLLCSDGFWDWLDDAALARSLESAVEPDQWLLGLEQGFRDRLRPGSDNYSAIAVWCGDQDMSTKVYPAAPPAATNEGGPR
jgi:serine/threonine protein phosphatase PrpC